MTHPSKRPWRTMIYFKKVDTRAGTAQVSLPGWDSEISVEVPLRELSEDVQSAAVPGYRCYAYVNIGAERKEDLVFREWEAHSAPCQDCGTVLFSGSKGIGWHCLCNNFCAESLAAWEQHVTT